MQATAEEAARESSTCRRALGFCNPVNPDTPHPNRHCAKSLAVLPAMFLTKPTVTRKLRLWEARGLPQDGVEPGLEPQAGEVFNHRGLTRAQGTAQPPPAPEGRARRKDRGANTHGPLARDVGPRACVQAAASPLPQPEPCIAHSARRDSGP